MDWRGEVRVASFGRVPQFASASRLGDNTSLNFIVIGGKIQEICAIGDTRFLYFVLPEMAGQYMQSDGSKNNQSHYKFIL